MVGSFQYGSVQQSSSVRNVVFKSVWLEIQVVWCITGSCYIYKIGKKYLPHLAQYKTVTDKVYTEIGDFFRGKLYIFLSLLFLPEFNVRRHGSLVVNNQWCGSDTFWFGSRSCFSLIRIRKRNPDPNFYQVLFLSLFLLTTTWWHDKTIRSCLGVIFVRLACSFMPGNVYICCELKFSLWGMYGPYAGWAHSVLFSAELR